MGQDYSINPAGFNPYKQQSLTEGADTGSLSYSTDSELWRMFKEGDEAAFAVIYRIHFPILYNYGTQFSEDRELVKDCIQDVFVDLRLKRKKMINTDAIKPFLFTILRRRMLKIIKVRNRQLSELHQEASRFFPIEVSPEQLLINVQLDDESITRLGNAINKLSVNEREAIFHFYYENHSYQQMADIMGFKHVRSARNLVYKALSSLRKHMEMGN